MKTCKFATKRLKLTKKGRVLFRQAGQNHFNAKQSGAKTRGKRGFQTMSKSQKKIFKQLLT
ncbi:50S ribosomal protein L35 [Patescibacteria group bacterium]|nr:50S ribosomal protein L35 [Patescibacteria group bacterium]